MTILESHRILIGACGWLHENWQDNFYPEDLPQDWYLGYYGNEFSVVLVRDKEWQQGGSVEEWLEETDDVPAFICELPLQDYKQDILQQAEKYLTAASKMAERCAGIVCRVNNSVNVEELKNLLQASQAIAPTVLAMDDASQEIQALMNELKVNPLWSSAEDNNDHGGSLYIARLDSSQLKLPDLRKSMENLLDRQSDHSMLILLIDGESPDMDTIKQAKIMLDLI